MSEEEKKAIEILRIFEPDDLVECSLYLQALEKVTNLIDKKQKEIEQQAKEIERKDKNIHKLNSDKIQQQKEIEEEHKNWKELLHEYGIKCQELEVLREENFDTIYMKAIADYKSKIREILQIGGNADIETYLKTIVAENNRLEDIEDDRDCNYISKDKIREKIKELEEEGTKQYWTENVVKMLKELLEE